MSQRGWLLALLVGLVAAAPLAWTPFFASDDGLVHLWRIWEYARTADAVGPIVRWVPDVAYGYGAPLFSFYNPLAYGLGAGLVGLGLTASAATRALFALSLIGSALGAYWLAEAWIGRAAPAAALCAALLYTIAPYRIATVYQRGALAEALGLAVAPLVVLCAWRAVERKRVGWVAGLAVATGAMVLFHTIAALMALPFAGLVGLARAAERPTGRFGALTRLCLGLALGLALAATYWLPALTQQRTVQLERARWSGETARFEAGFAWPWELVQPSLLHDYGRRVDDDQTPLAQRFPRLGGVALLALALGLAAGWRARRLRRPTGLVALAAIAASLGLAAPASLPLWNRVELLGAVQLGWRFLALLLLAAIPLAAELGARAGRPRALALALALLAAAGSMAHLPLERVEWSALRERPAELAAYERKDGQFALGALREYVPVWVATSPQELVLPSDRPIGDPVAPVSAALLGGSSTDRRYEVAAAAPTTVVLDLFY
ncbi:MAG TPA: 6-pyruvoyl-tetrahydropterin synthase-related protein, partial [Chloroflexota bacterium]